MFAGTAMLAESASKEAERREAFRAVKNCLKGRRAWKFAASK
jgi:hypothetical protein